MCAGSPDQKHIDFATFCEFAEFLCLPSDRINISAYRMHSKLGFLAEVCFNIQQEQQMQAQVNYYGAFKMIHDVILMFTDLPEMEAMLDFGIKSF